MQFKEGYTWKACYDENQDLYTAAIECCGRGYSLTLYEINKEIYDALTDGEETTDGQGLISKGRRLYMEVNDTCGPGYVVVLDEDYQKLCPWRNITQPPTDMVWPKEMTDAVIDVLASEKNNREQRKKKKDTIQKQEK